MNINVIKKIRKLVIITLFITISGFGQEKSNFIHLDQTFLGRSQIEEDSFGYLWISGADGLYKYNGYDYTLTSNKTIFGQDITNDRDFIFKKDSYDNFWVSSPIGGLVKIGIDGEFTSYKDSLNKGKEPVKITSIKSKYKSTWFGSATGTLYKFNYKNLTIENIITLPLKNNIAQKIKSIAITNNNSIWISTETGTIYNYSNSHKTLQELITPFINYHQSISLTSDKKGRLWFTTEHHGLFSYDITNENKFKKYQNPKSDFSNSKNDMFITLFCDSSGIIWAGTDGGGLYSVNPETDKVTIYKHDETNKFSLKNNTITNINEDSNGNIWIVVKKGYISIIPKNDSNISYYNGLENNTPTRVLSTLKSTDNSVWIGTDGKGLNRVFPDHSKVQYTHTKSNKYNFEGKYIQSLIEDKNGNIWIATYQNGLWFFNTKLETFTKVNTTNSNGISTSDIRKLFIDSKNRIWAATNMALNVYSDKKQLLASFDYNSNGLLGTISHSICEDENNSIWVGIDGGGLFKFNEDHLNLEKSQFTKYNYFLKENTKYYGLNIASLNPDYMGNLWILLNSGILIKYNLLNKSYESLANEKKIKHINISAILVENPNSIWLSSSNGIHHYILNSNSIKSYYQPDGLQGNSFLKRSSYKDKNGLLFFGGEDGVNSFLPLQMDNGETKAKLYINTIEILNKPANSIIPEQLNEGVENVKSLILDANQSSFSFQFSAIENVLNSNYYYAYKLIGFDKDWIESKKDRIATYTNIPYGDYTFEVKAGSKKCSWDIESKTIDLHIKPPLWYTPQAFILYFILFVLIIIGISNWVRLKNKLAKEEWQNSQEKELYALKMNFFAKMSHEIQTPLTLILGPIGDMLERAGTSGNQLLNQRLLMIKNNAKRLSRIATELMTVRNKELGRLKVFVSKNDLIKDLKTISISFSEQASFKNIDFIQNYSRKKLFLWYDTDKIEHVIYNLLSNAFKFTPVEGNITLDVELDSKNECVKIRITDSGLGIPKEELEDIFKLFYRSELSKNIKGSGIGLALTKELIELHHGQIHVKSSPESGTCFSVLLCTNENTFSEDEKINLESTLSSEELIDNRTLELPTNLDKISGSNIKKKYTVLIVEDNIEMQMFLQGLLAETYNILLADNGKQGLEIVESHQPDLIISDVMMPVMDGIEMCKKLQKKKATSHIPVILLTAKNTTKTKIKGLKSGAIEFIRKPFNIQEVLLKINNIISTKDKVLNKYKTDLISSPKEDTVKSKDEIFMESLVGILNNEMENPDFKLEELSSKLNMSYSVIYRKCQEITGKTLVEFVRSLRIKKAALLILKQGYNISEAAYMVGYKDSKYFTKCFKEEFGKAPNILKKETQKTSLENILKKYNLN